MAFHVIGELWTQLSHLQIHLLLIYCNGRHNGPKERERERESEGSQLLPCSLFLFGEQLYFIPLLDVECPAPKTSITDI